jgi:hypothetical protein
VASIQPSGAGFRVYYPRDGKRCASPTQPTREAAEQWMRDHLPTLAAEHIFDLLKIWRDEEPSPYRDEVELRVGAIVRRMGWHRLERLSLADLRAWQRVDPQPRTGQYLVTILRWAVQVHRIRVHPDVLAWRPAPYRRKPPAPLLTDEQVEAIKDCAIGYGPRASSLIDYLTTYGARPITACRLTVADLDLTHGELVIRHAKHSGGWRHVITADHLDLWPTITMPDRDPAGPLFPHYKEDRAWRIDRGLARELVTWYRNTIAKRLRLGAMSGIYHLKRYAITALLRKGVDPATVALFTGHLSLDQVLRYAKSNPDLQRAALRLLVTPTVTRLQDGKS